MDSLLWALAVLAAGSALLFGTIYAVVWLGHVVYQHVMQWPPRWWHWWRW